MDTKILPCAEGDAEYVWERDAEESCAAEFCGEGAEELLVFKVEAESYGIIGGCVLSIDLSGNAEFNRLWVDERFRRRGIGSALVCEAERAARERACQAIINAYNFDFQAAKPLFENLGYPCIGVAKDWPKGHESYIFLKRLYDASSELSPAPPELAPAFEVKRGDDADGKLIAARLEEYNSAFAPRRHPYIDLDRKLVDASGNIIGGCIAGVSGWDAAHIDLLWVDARFSGLGLEAALIGKIEREAKKLGAYIARTNAAEAQAELFKARGYEVVTVYDGCPKWFVMQKKL